MYAPYKLNELKRQIGMIVRYQKIGETSSVPFSMKFW